MSSAMLLFFKSRCMVPRMDINEQIAKLRESKRRREKALAMRRKGKRLQEIGDELGVTRERARQLVAKALQEETGS